MDHHLFMISGHSLDSVIRESSDLNRSKVYVSSGLFEIVKQTNHISLLTMNDCSQITMTEIWKANPFKRLDQFKNFINKDL